ncbi:MAG: TIM-barrel domain-containing protein [Chitinophagaceae bacterium]
MKIKNVLVLIYFCCASFLSFAQNKIFWHEDFSSGKLPQGWYIPKVGNWEPQWIVTDQPYPGSYQYQQQAPPIASTSRGYHLQFQAGYFTDEDVDSWVKKHQYPDEYVVSAPIDCSNHSSVILKFQQTFRWWNYHVNDTAGLFVGVSTDSIHWQQWDVRDGVKSATDMFAPMKEEINISKWAANQPKVFLRFYWKGLEAWYWMIDDIELSEANKKDIGIVRLLSQSESGNHFTANDTLKLMLRNNGSNSIAKKIKVNAIVDGKNLQPFILDATNKPMLPGEEHEVGFANINLANRPLHRVVFYVNMPGDENKNNDSLIETISNEISVLGNLSSWKKIADGVELTSGITKLKIVFYNNNIFRIWLAPDGNFTDPADSEIVVNQKIIHPTLSIKEDAKNIFIISSFCKLQIQKTPIIFSLFNSSGKLVFAEKEPLSFGSKTTQKLSRFNDEYFYGCGMQNGYFSHRNNIIKIEKGGGWDAGGRANPAPFYMSTCGYGALRNTFDIGLYDFTENMQLSHNENRFDCFYFVDSSLKNILNDYTQITGRPFMPARWQLSLGDANCYNKPGRDKQPQTTPDVIWKVADKYIAHNMPHGWILPNDGYGCGYVKLDSTVKELKKRGFYTGLWTENGVDKIATEVGKYGTRLCKLDVAWVGPGYKYALDACRAAFKGIENNSTSRGFVWSVMGWAGTQRYSTVWSGDQSGNWEYIRFHIPTVIGSGLSAFNCATGDVDGIFGGSQKTYVRDLQWKCFTPVFMVMSGWAKKDKQPYIYGEPYTSINRKYLQLKMRLTPYMYTLMNEAHTTGVPAVRGLVLEYQNDSTTWNTATQYEYLLGKSFLVAPVWKDEEERDSIYFPEGNWVDYWDGKIFSGKQWINNYAAPLEKLPLFVKAGSIIPMYPQMNYDGEKPLDTLTLDIYPQQKSSYNLYEDDGLTREYKTGKFATTNISCDENTNSIKIIIAAIKGSYSNMLEQRNYVLQIHAEKIPSLITINAQKISNTGWKFSNDKNGLLIIDCGKWNVNKKVEVIIK